MGLIVSNSREPFSGGIFVQLANPNQTVNPLHSGLSEFDRHNPSINLGNNVYFYNNCNKVITLSDLKCTSFFILNISFYDNTSSWEPDRLSELVVQILCKRKVVVNEPLRAHQIKG